MACIQVAYEYISCQQERNGVMILSEFAGAAQSLNGSLIINPCGCRAPAVMRPSRADKPATTQGMFR